MSSLTPPTFPETFEQEVRDCLAHLYDFSAMQNDPLVEQMVPHLSGLERIQTARKILIETIERLNQKDSASLQSKQARLYHILLLRYVEEVPTPLILDQLALSERQYYRELQRAVWVLSQMLWDQLAQPQGQASPGETISVQTEIERAYNMASQSLTNLEAFLSGVLGSIHSLAQQHNVILQVRSQDEPVIANLPQRVLKQALICILSEAIRCLHSGGMIRLYARVSDGQPIITLEITFESPGVLALEAVLAQDQTVSYLLQTMQAHLSAVVVSDHDLSLELRLPQHERKILVIDDNPDFIALITRYLANSPYVVVGTRHALEGIELSRKLQPLVIMLDVMMPELDGWEVLQHLKNHPDTQHIPILICSVLDTPELALSLGADSFLKKPPDRVDLLRLLAETEG